MNTTHKKRHIPVVGEIELKECKVCLVTQERCYIGKDQYKHSVYKNSDGNHWHGRVCPTCWKNVERIRTRKNRKPIVTKRCVICNTEFTTNLSHKKVCTDSCRTKLSYKKSPRKCRTCGNKCPNRQSY